MSDTTLRDTLAAAAEEQDIPRSAGWEKEYDNYWEALPENIREYLLERDGMLYGLTGISDIMRG
jgi:hypothetical protein